MMQISTDLLLLKKVIIWLCLFTTHSKLKTSFHPLLEKLKMRNFIIFYRGRRVFAFYFQQVSPTHNCGKSSH